MLSYMSIDRVEGDFAVCEVEPVPTTDAHVEDFFCLSCFMTDVPKAMFEFKGLPVKEGMVYTVLHNGETIDEVCGIDESERKRRQMIIQNLI